VDGVDEFLFREYGECNIETTSNHRQTAANAMQNNKTTRHDWDGDEDQIRSNAPRSD
jgi:hypothetical protein